MLSSIKLWLYSAGAALVALLFGMLKLRTYERDKAEQEAEKQANARAAENARHAQENKISDAAIKAKDEAKNVEIENNANRGKRPDGNFGDRRL